MIETVPFFSGARGVQRAWPQLEDRLRAVATRGVFTSGPEVAALEHDLAERTGAAQVVAVASGTDALILMLQAADIGPGDEVIIPAYTFFATASAVLHVGAEPVLVDVYPGSYAMDADRAEAAISPRTRAIMPVHLFSQMADVVRLRDLADRRGVDLLEDSAEGVGMTTEGRHAGRWGRAGVLSFFPTKTLGALGDAGALVTDDLELADRVRRGRQHGQRDSPSYVYEELGWNSRCDEIQAAVLRTRLATLDADIARRTQIAAIYTAELSTLQPMLTTPWQAPSQGEQGQVFYVYLVESDRRDQLAAYLGRHRVGTEVYYPRARSRCRCTRISPTTRSTTCAP